MSSVLRSLLSRNYSRASPPVASPGRRATAFGASFRPLSLASQTWAQTASTRLWHPPCKAYKFAVPTGSAPDCRFRSRRQFSSGQPRGDRYFRFRPDPDAPLDWRKWDTATKVIVVAVIGGMAYYLTHLEQVPETGRWRFMSVDPRYEARLAEQEHAAFLEEYKGKILPPTHPITQLVRQVVTAILEANNLGSLRAPDQGSYVPPAAQAGADDSWDPDALSSSTGHPEIEGRKTREWNLIVVDDIQVVNAAAGHGNIIVFTGILPVAMDEQGLAAVLSHEIAHVVARHVSEKLSSLLVLSFLVNLLAVLGLDANLAGLVMEFLYSLPNSRKQELEADKIGMQLASRACFDPRGAPAMQMRLAAMEKNSRLNLDFLYTHPTGQKRIKLLTEMLPEAFEMRAASSACANLQDEYDAFRDALETQTDRPGV